MFEIINKIKYKSKVYLEFFIFLFLPKTKERIINDFHKLFYDSGTLKGTWKNTKFLGVEAQKCPLDLFIYQEIIYEIKPDLIIETGTAFGGGAYFLASICELINFGKVVTVDITNTSTIGFHKRIKHIIGSSTDKNIFKQIKDIAVGKKKVMVILDSNHTKKHALKELELYSTLVTKDCYLIVEDTNVNGHPVYIEHGEGPMKAVQEFVKVNNHFMVDKSREKYYLTFNPSGYLKKIR